MRLTVKEACERLGTNPNKLRKAMLSGMPIGEVVKEEGKNTFLIYSEKIDAYLNGNDTFTDILECVKEILIKVTDIITDVISKRTGEM